MAQQPGKRWIGPFGVIWTGQACSLFGSSIVQFALVWWLTQTTGSATVLATATLLARLPDIVLGPLAGALVDRWNRRLTMIVADGLTALALVALALLAAAGAMRPWHVVAIMVLRAITGVFHWPAMEASTSLMVPDQHLARVGGINQSLEGAMRIVAPPLGALALVALPFYSVLAIDILTALLAIASLLFVAIPQPVRRASGAVLSAPSLWQDIRAGFSYIWDWPGLRWLVLIGMGVNMFGSASGALRPLLVTQHFGGGALQLGWLNSTSGVGVVLGGLLLGAWGGFRRRAITMMAGLIGGGLGTLLLGLAPANLFVMALLGTFITGITNALTNGPLFALMQARVAPEMQGRVFTTVGSLAGAISPLGLLIAGPFADALGVPAWYVLAGASLILIGASGLRIPSLTHMEDCMPPGEGAAPRAAVAGQE